MPRHPLVAAGCLLAATVLATACAGSDGDVGSADADLTETKVRRIAQVELPIPEVSGLGRRTVEGNSHYLAIGDDAPTIVTFDIDDKGEVFDIATHDVENLFGKGATQWEAVTGDTAGRVFILKESGSITVLDSELTKIVHTMTITIPKDHPLYKGWDANPNSRGEGLVLLSNGHIIIAKEKAPSAIIELAPKGAAAEGYNPTLALGTTEFPLPKGEESELVPVAYWSFKSKDTSLMSDISELAVTAEGRLVLLSDESNAIATIEKTLDPTESKIDFRSVFALPRSIKKPEGLTFANGVPFVATDGKNIDKDALYQLEPLP